MPVHVELQALAEVGVAEHGVQHADDRRALAVRDGVEHLLHLLGVRDRHLSAGHRRVGWSVTFQEERVQMQTVGGQLQTVEG